MDGMKLSPSNQFTWSIVFFFLGPFLFFTLVFVLGIFFFTHLFFGSRHPSTQVVLWELLSTPPTYLPPFHHPTHLPPPTYPTTHLQALPLPKLQNHKELVELTKLGKLVELVESLWSLGSLESLWSLKRTFGTFGTFGTWGAQKTFGTCEGCGAWKACGVSSAKHQMEPSLWS